MKKKTLLLAALAFALVLGMGIAPAWAYFTDTTYANGTLEIEAGPTPTHIKEWYGTRVKHLQFENDADASAPVFVRAKVFAEPLEWTAAGEGWSAADDGWFVYAEAIDPGASTEELTVEITFPRVKSETEPTGAVYGDTYNVDIVYESTLARYDEQGNPVPDWDNVLDSKAEHDEGGR